MVAQADLDRLHDRLYVLEAALDDVTADVAHLRPRSPAAARAARYEAALAHLRAAAEELRGVVVEPATE